MDYKEYRRKLTEELAESENKDYRKGIGFALTVLDDMIEYPIAINNHINNPVSKTVLLIDEIKKADFNYKMNQCWNYEYLIKVMNKLIDIVESE